MCFIVSREDVVSRCVYIVVIDCAISREVDERVSMDNAMPDVNRFASVVKRKYNGAEALGLALVVT